MEDFNKSFNKIKEKIESLYPNFKVEPHNGGIRISGEAEDYNDILTAGNLAVDKVNSRGVINDVVLKNHEYKPMRLPEVKDNSLEGAKPDVLIIGGGIVGTAIMRELSRFNLDILLIEKEYDLATAQSSRNDGMIHAGIDLKPTSKKLHYNMRGNALYDTLSKELDVPIRRVGQYVLFTGRLQKLIYPFIKSRSRKNKTSIKFLSKEKIRAKFPSTKLNYGGIFCYKAGIVSPYLMTVRLAESAVINGAKLSLNTACLEIENNGESVVSVLTNRGRIFPKVLINASGVWSDKIAEQAGDRFFTIHPRRGTEAVLDKKAGVVTNSVIGRFAFTGKSHTKGGGIIRTIDENILLGPTATESPDREDEDTRREELQVLFKKHGEVTPLLDPRQVITYFAGTRAASYEEEFIVERSPVIKNLIQSAGIQSPGVTAAPAIAEDIAKFTLQALNLEKSAVLKDNFVANLTTPPRVNELSLEERDALIKQNPDYGIIICRCEEISKGEIIDAINSPIPCHTLDGLKRRIRTGMGRCQGGFCAPLITKIIAEQTGVSILEVEKKGGGKILFEKTK
ncbi:MAG: NAD(P)/FAD-dependent oxidoreductase [Firmicutes bacterium]|nr:NAD(P)/FAD-dependent oxidoreductase [Bacillota bacterium]